MDGTNDTTSAHGAAYRQSTSGGAPTADHLLSEAAHGAATEFDHQAFREAMSTFATGITVVTMTAPQEGGEDELFGITVNAFMSVSLEPPLIAVSIDRRARAHATLHAAERFGVSVLADDQAHLSDQFAGRPVAQPEQPFERLAGFPVVRGALAQLVLRREDAFLAGDHTIFIGRVEALRSFSGEPLLYFRSGYRRFGAP